MDTGKETEGTRKRDDGKKEGRKIVREIEGRTSLPFLTLLR